MPGRLLVGLLMLVDINMHEMNTQSSYACRLMYVRVLLYYADWLRACVHCIAYCYADGWVAVYESAFAQVGTSGYRAAYTYVSVRTHV